MSVETIRFTVPGEPKSKLRHRTTNKGFNYTPKKTMEYENWVKQCYIIENGSKKVDGQIRATIRAYFTIPGSSSKKKKAQMVEGMLRPTKKPDTDNIAKAILDSLNSIAYDDDKSVVSLLVEKYYSESPRVEVVIESVDGN
jgi:Holliday junction resolvase RusA-like endonuclease